MMTDQLTTTTSRIFQLDLIRVVAIFLVIIVHTHMIPSFSSFSWSYWPLYLLYFLGKLGVPLFVMLSGTLLLSKEEAPAIFYSRRFTRVVIPWLVWATVYFIIKIVSGQTVLENMLSLFREYLIVLLSDFWFMPMIIALYGLTPLLKNMIISKTQLQLLLLSWLLLTSILPALYLSPYFPGSSSAGLLTLALSFSGYYLLGWYLRKYQSSLSALHLITVLGVSFVLYLILGNLYASSEHSLFFVLHDYLSPPVVIASAALFLGLLKLNNQAIKPRLLNAVSQLSFGVFLSHVLVANILRKYVLQLQVEGSTNLTLILGWLMLAVLVYSSSALLIWMIAKLPHAKQFVT